MPRCVPVEVKRNQHGERATTIEVGIERVLSRGKWRTVELLTCPVTFSPSPQQIEAARRAYDDWWRAPDWTREGLLDSGMLRDVELINRMPKAEPWTRHICCSTAVISDARSSPYAEALGQLAHSIYCAL